MTDLRKTQAEWDRFLGRELIGMHLAVLAELEALQARYSKQRTLVVVQGDDPVRPRAGAVELTGVDVFRNTSPEGTLFARIEGAADPRTVRLYRAPGGAAADLVAEGQGDAGTVVVLVERGGSGVSGSWALPQAVAEDTSDRLRLVVLPDWRERARRVWDGSVAEDSRSLGEFADALEQVALQLADARRVMLDALRRFATGPGSRGAEFLGQVTSALFRDTPVRDPSGAVSRRRSGFLVELSRAMRAETLAGPQAVVGRDVVASPAVFAPTNRGLGRVDAHTPREFCPAARWTFRCVRGLETGHGGAEEFAGSVRLEGEDQEVRFSGIRVKQSFAGPKGLGPFVLERVYTKAGDPNDQVLAGAAGVVTAGERAGNTEAGVLHWEVAPSGGGWRVAFFRSASRASGDLVSEVTGVAPGAAFQATERNAAGLSVTWELGPQPQAATGTLDCNFFRVEGAAGVPDSFVIETEVRQRGRVQALLSEQLGGAIAGAGPGSPVTVSEARLAAGALLRGLGD